MNFAAFTSPWIIPVVLVVAALAFFAFQLHRNTRAVRSAHRRRITESATKVFESVINEPDMGEIVRFGLNDMNTVSQDDRVRLHYFLQNLVLLYQDSLDAMTSKVLSQEEHESNRRTVMATLKMPGAGMWWRDAQKSFPANVRDDLNRSTDESFSLSDIYPYFLMEEDTAVTSLASQQEDSDAEQANDGEKSEVRSAEQDLKDALWEVAKDGGVNKALSTGKIASNDDTGASKKPEAEEKADEKAAEKAAEKAKDASDDAKQKKTADGDQAEEAAREESTETLTGVGKLFEPSELSNAYASDLKKTDLKSATIERTVDVTNFDSKRKGLSSTGDAKDAKAKSDEQADAGDNKPAEANAEPTKQKDKDTAAQKTKSASPTGTERRKTARFESRDTVAEKEKALAEKAKAEKEAKAEKARAEKEAKARAEKEAKAKKEAKAEKEAKAKAEKEAKAKAEKEAKAEKDKSDDKPELKVVPDAAAATPQVPGRQGADSANAENENDAQAKSTTQSLNAATVDWRTLRYKKKNQQSGQPGETKSLDLDKEAANDLNSIEKPRASS